MKKHKERRNAFMTGITIMDRNWVQDPNAPRGRKEVVVYGVTNSSLIDSILSFNPNIGDGSLAICLSENVCKILINRVWS
jgi:hypothetical protein